MHVAVKTGLTGLVLLLVCSAAAAAEKVSRGEGLLDGEPRFNMLATIHAFAEARLSEASDYDSARRAHASFFLDLSERRCPPRCRWPS